MRKLNTKTTTKMEVVSKNSLQLHRTFTFEGVDVFSMFEWGPRTAEIKNADGEVLFRQSVIAPNHWSDQSVQIVASKYLYGDVNAHPDTPVEEGGREDSIRQLIWRVANTIATSGMEQGYFDVDDLEVFRDELIYILVNQMAAFNSPVWFNVGLHHEYGITETGDKKLFGWKPNMRGMFGDTEGIDEVDPYERPQASACFIISVEDSIDDIWKLMGESARLFKYGSGVGADWSKLRSTKEKISGGGIPSGPVSFMKVQDATGGTIKSGGKTRRAAIMQTLKVTHPDIMEFVTVKQNEEKKAWSLINEGYDGSFNGDAYGSVAFQNVNQSVRVTDEFMNEVTTSQRDEDWYEVYGVDGSSMESRSAGEVMDAIAEGTYICGDPGVMYEETIQEWHTCKNSGPINSSNPCGEFQFIDDSACNLASINLLKFYNRETKEIEVHDLSYVSRLLITAMDILVDMSGYPSKKIAQNSHDYRPLGLGFANLGALLMNMGLAYDSQEGRALAGGLMAIIHGSAYLESARWAARLSPFNGYDNNSDPMLTVLRKHSDAITDQLYINHLDDYIWEHANQLLASAYNWGSVEGFRNSQVTVLAPTGTISFMMGCDTTGIEPVLGLVTYKLLAGKGDGMMKLVTDSVEPALRNLGYLEQEIHEILMYIEENGSVHGCETLQSEHLPVFATSFGEHNTLSANAHIDMMAACQPFISGAISKTVNLPESATVEDIKAAYTRGWEKGLKAVAIYRENSKRSQPLSVKKDEAREVIDRYDPDNLSKAMNGDGVPFPADVEAVLANVQPIRKKLPDDRQSITHKFSINGHEGYLHIGLYPDTGTPGEIFITMSKQGSTISGMMDAFAIAISMCLQWGVPMEVMVEKFTHTRFEPSGFTSNPDIRTTTSVVDYIFKYLRDKFSEKVDVTVPRLSFDFWDGVESKREGFEIITRNPEPTTDAPPCSVCGTITVRAGSCYSCPSCGNSTGCG